MPALFADLRWRGLVHQVTDPALGDLLDAGGLTAYAGFDPTAESLHIGNLLQLTNLRRLQLGGHRPIVLAGGATGMIGDPGGKTSERQMLDAETLRRNVEGVLPQLRRFLDFADGPAGATLVNNYDWLKDVSVLDFLRDVGKHFTVNQLIARDLVRSRIEQPDQSISYTEFSYGLLQAHDFLHLHRTHGCRLQLGGSDQWANIVGGVDLIRRRTGATAFGLCSPLVTKADGTKFGKSETGAIWLDRTKTSPYALYQYFLRSEDVMVGTYLRYFTFLGHDRIEELDRSVVERPREREAHRALAFEVTALVHGEDEAHRAVRASEALFGEEIASLDEQLLLDVFAEAPSVDVSRERLGSLALVDLLVEAGLSPSKSAARTAISQGGISVNDRRYDEVSAVVSVDDLLHDRYVVLRRGKKEYALARFA